MEDHITKMDKKSKPKTVSIITLEKNGNLSKEKVNLCKKILVRLGNR